jgi:hypothetical protein
MPLGMIRSRFIQRHLEKALTAGDPAFASRVAYEFRRYFEWFASSIDESDRESIAYQLRLLEEACRNSQTQAPTGSALH